MRGGPSGGKGGEVPPEQLIFELGLPHIRTNLLHVAYKFFRIKSMIVKKLDVKYSK